MEDIRTIVEKVVSKVLLEMSSAKSGKEVISNGVTLIKTDTVKPDPFNVNGKEIEGVYVKDVLTIEESPNLGVAVMEMEKTEFPWTLNYDEVDYIVSGTLEIECGGKSVRGLPGDMIFIPKGSSIKFRSLDRNTRFICIMYPANWSEL